MSFQVSILDVAPVGSGSTARNALKYTVELARLAERLGYVRFWLAEHHGMPSIASSSPEVLIAHVAAHTERLRVGAGGIMLPNHVPLRVAEVFHTLESLHPGRIDLGIGRAPGTDPVTSSALRPFDANLFPSQMMELIGLSRGELPADHPFHKARVIPDGVQLPPIWLLGSSGASAQFAGRLGVGYVFASHFSPTPPGPALEAYRESFQPSEEFPEPHVILAVSIICAETDEQAEYLSKSQDLMWVRLQKGELARIPTPEEAAEYPYTPVDRSVIQGYRALAYIGSPDRIRNQIQELAEDTQADEIMVSTLVHDPEARLRSYELVAEALIG